MIVELAVDTNILAYAEGINGHPRHMEAIDITDRLAPGSTFVPLQVLGELFRVLVRKGKLAPERAMDRALRWRDTFEVVETTDSIFLAATQLSVAHCLDIWDAIILAAAASAGCRLLLSEDMQDGFTWDGVTVANPFKTPRHPLLVSVLEN